MAGTEPVGREPELAALRAHLRASEQGMRVVLVHGPRWSGRSGLLRALATVHDAPVLRAVGQPWETTRAGGVLDQLVGVAAGMDCDDLAQHLRTLAPPSGALLVTVDDAQYADLPSLQALASLRRHHRTTPALILLAVPLPAPVADPDVLELLDGLPDHRIELGPLPVAALGQLAEAHGRSLSPWALERLHRHTGGLPGAAAALLAEVAPSTWEEPDPELPAACRVASWTARQYAGLSPDAQRFVGAASILELDRSLRLVRALAALDDEWAALDAAVGSGLIRLRGARGAPEVWPADAMTAAAIRQLIGPAACRDLHLAAAARSSDPASALRHRVAAANGPDAELATALDALAEDRAARGAWAQAAGLLTDASRLSDDRADRERRLIRAVDALVGAGDVRPATALGPEVASLRETPLRDAVLGYLALPRGRGVDAQEQLDRAWGIVNPEREPSVAALICQRHVLHALARCAWDDVVTWADRAMTLTDADAPAAVEAAAIRGLGLGATGALDEALDGYRRCASG